MHNEDRVMNLLAASREVSENQFCFIRLKRRGINLKTAFGGLKYDRAQMRHFIGGSEL